MQIITRVSMMILATVTYNNDEKNGLWDDIVNC